MPRPQYIDTPAGPIFSVLHQPAPTRAGEGRPAVLFCAPWGWNETVSYHSRRTWAEALAAEGHPVLRFDLPAVGSSIGTPRDGDLLSTWVAAVGAVAAWLRGAAPGRELAVVGMELGGLLALEAAREGAPIDALALWATPRDGRGFVRLTQAFSRMQAWEGGPDGDSPLPEGWIEAAGFVLSEETSAALRTLKPATATPPAGIGRALLLGRDDAEPDQTLVEHLRAAGAAVKTGPGPGWDDMVTHPGYTTAPSATMERLSEWLGAGARDGAPALAPGGAPAETEIAQGGAAIREAALDCLPPRSFGVLAEPAAGAESDHCIVFFNAGAVRHIGPNRLWVDAVRDLAAGGARTVRIDLAGIGEADGDSDRFAEIAEFYDPEFGTQTRAILSALEAAGLGRRFMLVGLCSGGYWCYRIALEDPRVERALLLNAGALRWRSSLVMERDGKGIGMLFEGRLWRKLLRGKFDLKKVRAFGLLVVRRLRDRVRGLLRGRRGAAESAGASIERDAALEAELDSLRERGVALTMAFSAAEKPHEEFEAKGIPPRLGDWPNVRLLDLPGIDHALAPTAAQAAARELIHAEVEAAGLLGAAAAPAQSS